MIKVWDKKESINGVSAEEYTASTPKWMLNGDVLLIIDDSSGMVTQVENVNVLRANLKLDSSLKSEEVGEAYLKSLEPVTTENTAAQ